MSKILDNIRNSTKHTWDELATEILDMKEVPVLLEIIQNEKQLNIDWENSTWSPSAMSIDDTIKSHAVQLLINFTGLQFIKEIEGIKTDSDTLKTIIEKEIARLKND